MSASRARTSYGSRFPVWLCWAIGIAWLFTGAARAAPVEFDIPAQPAADALLLFSKQARCDVLYSYDELSDVESSAVKGRYEPQVALTLLLRHTGFAAQRNGGTKFVVTRIKIEGGSITGRILDPAGSGLAGVHIDLPGAHRSLVTDNGGGFTLRSVPPGTYSMLAAKEGYQALRWEHLRVRSTDALQLTPQTLQPVRDPVLLEPFVVVDATTQSQSSDLRPPVPRMAVGNLDLPRSENDALPYKIYSRRQITRSGVVDLNEFLRRELIDSDASTLPPEQNSTQAGYLAGSSNLNLRGYGSDATIILVNGRRMPESAAATNGMLGAPDVNSIPLSLVEQVEVLPASAAALYNGNPVGGVINIVLRPDIDGTELRTTYTNAVAGHDAPQSSVSLLHGHTLWQGRLRLRLSASFSQTVPPTESELGYRRAHDRSSFLAGDNIHRATPNVRSAAGLPLFGPGSATYTSVAPGADGTGGASAFSGREGTRSLALFDSPGGFAASPESIDNPYGRRQRRASYFLSAVCDPTPWLQLGVDASYTRTVVNRGYDVFSGDLTLAADSPMNPFQQEVVVSLNETAPKLGEDYSEAHLELFSTVIGALVRLPADWQASCDAQYARNLARYRGLAGVDHERWQQLVDEGSYNPLRDTQIHGPPSAFYEQALIHYGHRNQFSKLGDYSALDTSIRLTNQTLPFPTGLSAVALGFDYRRMELEDYVQELRFADDTPAETPVLWDGRTLERLSLFGELQAPLLPVRWRPSWLKNIETDLAVRYIAADTSRETNLAPTVGLKLDLTGGWSLRGSATFSNRYPTAAMSRRVELSSGGSPGANYANIYDPRRDQSYIVEIQEDTNPSVIPEGSVTQSAGLMFHRGEVHRFRASLDFIDTRKENELLFLESQTVLNLESLWPERVARDPVQSGDPHNVGYVSSLLTGVINVSWRHSQNWNASLDYTWSECFGGRLDAYGRFVYFQSYKRRVLPTTAVVDELTDPDGTASGLMRYRSNFGASWTGRRLGFGFDGHYYHSRVLPRVEWPSQGSDHIGSFWQFDAYVQSDLTRWLPWKTPHGGLTAQLRINNLFDAPFPRYANDASGAGVQAYGDWRGQTYSLSLTATF